MKFRNTRPGLPDAKSFRVTYRAGKWHAAFAVIPDPVDAPGNGETVGIDRGVAITAALSDGRALNCPQLSVKERARLRKHQRRASRARKGSPQRKAEHTKAARLKTKDADRRKDWCEKPSTMLARSFDTIRFEKPHIRNMTRSASRAVFTCSNCGFTCNADLNASNNIAAVQDGKSRPRLSAGAGGMTRRSLRVSVNPSNANSP